MQSFFLPWRASRIHYWRGGSGNKWLFCFHGYGESAASFSFLEAALGKEYTLCALDLPFHGATEWGETLFFAPDQLLEILDRIGDEHGQRHPWSLLGYSMGGRVALSILELVPEKIERLMLIAPDGLVMNPWYWLATQTKGGRSLFNFTMHHPGWFFIALRIGNLLRWVNPSIYKFVVTYIGDQEVRRELYTRWITMRGFKPHLSHIKEIVRIKQLPVRLLYGQFDRIIREERGERFRKGIEPWCRLSVLPTGHRLLHPRNIDSIVSAIFTDH